MGLEDHLETGKRTEEAAKEPTKAYNLLWVAPRLPTQRRSGTEPFHQPIPPMTVKNMRGIADRNQQVDVRLWVDSRRLTKTQMEWLGEMPGDCPSQNLSLLDLQTIDDYANEPFYQQQDDNRRWRSNTHSLIWRQVDTARILACLQGNYDQVFYSDADITNLVVDSSTVQSRLKKHGVIISGVGSISNGTTYMTYENGLFGFTRTRRDVLRQLYEQTLRDGKQHKMNGYATFKDFIYNQLIEKEGIDTREIVFSPNYDSTEASFPYLDG